MVIRDVPLNPVQLEVLAWVRDGCPSGVHEGSSHRITARALHNRGLIRVSGHGGGWTASIEQEGVYYLDHGEYPPAPAPRPGPPPPADLALPEPGALGDMPAQRTPQKRRDRPQKPSVTERFIDELIDAGPAGVEMPMDKIHLLRRRVADAERAGRIPDGMRIAVRPFRREEEHGARVRMERLPNWFVLAPRSRRRGVVEHTTSAVELDGSERFQVEGAPRERALRLVDALVEGGASEGVAVSAALGVRIDDGRRYNEVHRDELVFAVEPDEVKAWFVQKTLQVKHEPTVRELARARQGYLFPDFDDVPDENLTFMVDGRSGIMWAGSWTDSDEQHLEQMIPRILEEVLFRLDAAVALREAERRREEAQLRALKVRREAWDRAREDAVAAFRRQFLVTQMLDQAAAWQQAALLQRYADAVRHQAQSLEDRENSDALEWTSQIEAHADRVNPLPNSAATPTPPEPTMKDLEPFMGKHGPYRP